MKPLDMIVEEREESMKILITVAPDNRDSRQKNRESLMCSIWDSVVQGTPSDSNWGVEPTVDGNLLVTAEGAKEWCWRTLHGVVERPEFKCTEHYAKYQEIGKRLGYIR